MAQATGFVCDRCKQFAYAETDKRLPPGWITVTIATDPDALKARPGNGHDVKEPIAASPSSTLHLCGSLCMAHVGAERHEAETGERFKPPTDSYKCPQCPKAFGSKSGIANHLSKAHGISGGWAAVEDANQ